MEIPIGGLLLIILLMAGFYGICMGFFAGFREGGPYAMQWFAGVAKVPALFFLTLAVTFPSLYVFNALAGSRLDFVAVFQLLVAALAVNVAVLASLGPIVAFFSVSTASYPFILLLNVLVFVVSGLFGFSFMLKTLRRLSVARQMTLPTPPYLNALQGSNEPEGKEAERAAVEPMPDQTRAAEATAMPWGVQSRLHDQHVRTIFICWMIVFGLVIAQMAWVLRPFVGESVEPFQWFCPRQSNFFQSVWDAFRMLLS